MNFAVAIMCRIALVSENGNALKLIDFGKFAKNFCGVRKMHKIKAKSICDFSEEFLNHHSTRGVYHRSLSHSQH